MTTVNYKDLDHIGPFRVDDVEATLEATYGVPVLMTRAQYVHHAEQLGMRRVINESNSWMMFDRAKLAREATRHLNWHTLNDKDVPEPTEEISERNMA